MKKLIVPVSILIILALFVASYFLFLSPSPVTAPKEIPENYKQTNISENIQNTEISFVGTWQGLNNSGNLSSDLTITQNDNNTLQFELNAYYGDHFGNLSGIALINGNTATYTTNDGVIFKFILDTIKNQINLDTTDYTYQTGANVRYDDIYVKVLE